MADMLRDRGCKVMVDPLLEIEFQDPEFSPENIDALAVTSKNGPRAMLNNSRLEGVRQKPLFAVGEGTAQVAREVGFMNVWAAEGNVHSLAELILTQRPRQQTILHLAGEKLAGNLATDLQCHNIKLLQPVFYRANAAEKFSATTVKAIRNGKLAAVVLMSPRTAKIFCQLVIRHGLVAYVDNLTAICISRSVASHVQIMQTVSSPAQDVNVVVELVCQHVRMRQL
jgi:uroporphyrinogen-III synthase